MNQILLDLRNPIPMDFSSRQSFPSIPIGYKMTYLDRARPSLEQ